MREPIEIMKYLLMLAKNLHCSFILYLNLVGLTTVLGNKWISTNFTYLRRPAQGMGRKDATMARWCVQEGIHKVFLSLLTEGCQSGKEGKQRPLFPCGFTHFEVAEK